MLDSKQLKDGFKKDMWKNIFQKNSFILTATINNERGETMASIKFELPERYKRQLKIRAAQDGITLTKLVLGSLYATVPPQNGSSDNHNNVKNRIDEISAVLAKHGASMTKEEREKLKAEREQLKKDMREK